VKCKRCMRDCSKVHTKKESKKESKKGLCLMCIEEDREKEKKISDMLFVLFGILVVVAIAAVTVREILFPNYQ